MRRPLLGSRSRSTPGLARSRPAPPAGSVVPTSRASTWSTPRAKGNRPAKSAQTTERGQLRHVVGQVVGENRRVLANVPRPARWPPRWWRSSSSSRTRSAAAPINRCPSAPWRCRCRALAQAVVHAVARHGHRRDPGPQGADDASLSSGATRLTAHPVVVEQRRAPRRPRAARRRSAFPGHAAGAGRPGRRWPRGRGGRR